MTNIHYSTTKAALAKLKASQTILERATINGNAWDGINAVGDIRGQNLVIKDSGRWGIKTSFGLVEVTNVDIWRNNRGGIHAREGVTPRQ
jgi:hypothetical protein